MLGVMVLRSALSALSTMFGSFGVFFVYLSFLKPAFGIHAVVSFGAAMAILWSSQKPEKKRPR